MLVRIWKDELLKAMRIYEHEMSEFIYQPLSPAMLERMKYKIEAVRHHHKNMDRNPVWDVPIEILQTSPGTFELGPILDGFSLEEKPSVPF